MPKVKKITEEKASDWQVVFCSLSIILVSFFVMLCSYATMEKGKMVEVKKSFRGALDIFSGGILFDKGDGIVVPSPDVYGTQENKVATPIYYLLKGKGLADKVNLKSTSDYVSLTVMESLLFEKDSAVITEPMKPVLTRLALMLQQFDLPIRVEGHTAKPEGAPAAEGSAQSWALSALRAANVMQYIKEAGNIPSDHLSAVGYSQYRPFLRNKTEEERRQNRRVEIIIPLNDDFFDKRGTLLKKAPPSFKAWDLST